MIQEINNRLHRLERKIKCLQCAPSTSLFYETSASFPVTGEAGTLYVDETNQEIYFWNGSAYTLLSEAPSNFEQITGVTLLDTEWILVGDYYQYTYSNVLITSTTLVDIVPSNVDFQIVTDAQILPQTLSSVGQVIIYAVNAPTANISITLNLFHA